MADFAEMLDPASILDAGNTEPIENEEIVDGAEPSEDELTEPVEGDEGEPTEPVEGEDAEPKEGEDDEPKDEKGDKKSAGKGDDDVDLRKAAPELRNALNKLRETDPKGAKLLRAALGHDLAYQETFKSPEEARVFKASVDAVGGPEAIAEMQEQVAYSQEIDALADAGDPKVLDTFFNDFPDGTKKLAPVFLEKLRELDAKAFNAVLQPHLVDSLVGAEIPQVFDALLAAANEGNTEAIKKIAGNLVNWMKGNQSSAQKFRTTTNDPERDKIKSEWDKINTEKESSFTKQWSEPVKQHAMSSIYKAGLPYVRTVPMGQQKAFFQEVVNEIQRRMDGDKTYAQQENALMKSKTRDASKIANFKNAKVDVLVPSVIEKIAKDFGFKATAAKAAGSKPAAGAKAGVKPVVGAGSSPMNPVYIKDKPAQQDRDLSVKNAIELQIAGKALMKSGPYKGKWVTWRPKAN